jgi:hypothetical protein
MTTLALSDDQLRFVTACCQPLPPEKRSVFLERLVAFLEVRDRLHRPSDDDLAAAARSALAGLVHEAVAAK